MRRTDEVIHKSNQCSSCTVPPSPTSSSFCLHVRSLVSFIWVLGAAFCWRSEARAFRGWQSWHTYHGQNRAPGTEGQLAHTPSPHLSFVDVALSLVGKTHERGSRISTKIPLTVHSVWTVESQSRKAGPLKEGLGCSQRHTTRSRPLRSLGCSLGLVTWREPGIPWL